MKNFILSFIFLIMCCFASKAQSGYVINDVDMFPGPATTYYCDSIITIDVGVDSIFGGNADLNAVIQGNNFQPSPLEATIYWGDGTNSVHTASATGIGQTIQFTPGLSHTYSQGGYYSVTILITNTNNNTTGGDTLNITVGNCNFDLYSFVGIDCDSNGNTDSTINDNVPFILTNDSNGQTYNGTLTNGSVNYWGVPPGYYSYEIDPVWLANNGYNAYYNPFASIYIDSINNPITTQVTLICNDSLSNTLQNCFAGQVYCDDNQNGVYDQGESPVANAPVNIYPYMSNAYTVYTDQNGYFHTTYSSNNSGTGQNYVIAQVNGQWMQQNGYTSNFSDYYVVDTIYDTQCDSTPELVNLPMNCPSSLDTGCVSGYVFCDVNGNSVLDSLESPIANAPVHLNVGQYTVTVYTDSFGYFNYCGTDIPPGSLVTGSLDNTWLQSHGYVDLSGGGVLTFQSSNTPTVYTVGFPIDCGGGTPCTDLWVNVTPWIGYYQNQTNYIKLNWGSYGPGIVGDYELTLTFPAGVTPITSSFANQNYTISGNTITWTLNENSSFFSTYDVIYFDTPSGIPSGTAHHFIGNIVPINGGTDCCLSNNASCLLQIVGNSYDPNDKLVDQPEMIDPNKKDTLTYTVRFQNTGTAPAQDIYIIDTISNKLDLSTLEIVSTSHHMELMEMGNNVLKFNFPQIWLPDSNANEPASHGYVTYRIVEQAANSIGDEIENTAHIYFDWNPAIVTNTTYNINMEGSTIEENTVPNMVVYPNPSHGIYNFTSDATIESIMVMNLNGKLLLEVQPKSNRAQLNISDFANGVYIIKAKSGDQYTMHKVVKK